MLNKIHVLHNPDEKHLQNLGVKEWPIWTKEVSEFPWYYDSQETFYVLEGRVTVTFEGGDPVDINPGDLVTFPKGMSCMWNIHEDIKKHYKFSDD